MHPVVDEPSDGERQLWIAGGMEATPRADAGYGGAHKCSTGRSDAAMLQGELANPVNQRTSIKGLRVLPTLNDGDSSCLTTCARLP